MGVFSILEHFFWLVGIEKKIKSVPRKVKTLKKKGKEITNFSSQNC